MQYCVTSAMERDLARFNWRAGGEEVFFYTVNEATDTTISVTITTRPGESPQPPIVLIVRNPVTDKETSRSNLFTLVNGTSDVAPIITRVSPGKAQKEDFPVTLIGQNFGAGSFAYRSAQQALKFPSRYSDQHPTLAEQGLHSA